MRIFLSVTAAEYEQAVERTGGRARRDGTEKRRFAHVAYRIGPDSTLLRRTLPLRTAGDCLSLSDRDAPPVADPEELARAVAGECSRRGYSGAVLDFEEPLTEDRRVLCAVLFRRLRAQGRDLYLPRACIDAAPEAVALIGTAVSGGDFETYLREELHRRDGRPAALDAERLRMDFTLPAPEGIGVPLDEAEFRARAEGKSVFFSPELCARYFTCTVDGAAHFVLFDDADTLHRKLLLGERLGVGAAFLMWPEIRDIARDLRW